MTALDQAILDNEKLVYFAVHQYYPTLLGDEDIIQLGRIGLWKAIQSYKPGSSKFGNYAVVCIKHEIDRYFQGQNSKKRKPPVLVYLDDTPEDAEDCGPVHEVILGTADIDYLDADAILARLTKKQRVILSRLLSGYCVAEIARHLGSTKFLVGKEVSHIKTSVLKEVTVYE